MLEKGVKEDIYDRLLKKRGILKNELSPRYEELIDPFLLPDMEVGVNRIVEAIERQERIIIYGDYDVDGVSASAVMYETLKMAGAGW